MYYMILFVVDELEECPNLFAAWESVGVTGITILESTGLGRIRKLFGYRDDIPLMPSLSKLMQQTREEHHRTLITVVDSEETVDLLIAKAEEVLGDLNQPNKGALFVLPVLRAVGITPPKAEDSATS